MNVLNDQSIDLVVTSPPYPMIEMWNKQFKLADPGIERLIENGDGRSAFEAMHSILDRVWTELYRVMKDGAIACVSIDDATRTINKYFKLFPNHSRIQKKFFDLGFNLLPFFIWRKQTNAPNKFGFLQRRIRRQTVSRAAIFGRKEKPGFLTFGILRVPGRR